MTVCFPLSTQNIDFPLKYSTPEATRYKNCWSRHQLYIWRKWNRWLGIKEVNIERPATELPIWFQQKRFQSTSRPKVDSRRRENEKNCYSLHSTVYVNQKQYVNLLQLSPDSNIIWDVWGVESCTFGSARLDSTAGLTRLGSTRHIFRQSQLGSARLDSNRVESSRFAEYSTRFRSMVTIGYFNLINL